MPEYKDVTYIKKQIADCKRAIQSANSDYLTGYVCALSATEGAIAEAPTADVVEVRHGKWLPNEMEIEENTHYYGNRRPIMTSRLEPLNYRCSVCGRIEPYQEPYCNCGAKMDGKGD